MTELEVVICEASLQLQLRLKLGFCPRVQTGKKAGEVEVPSPSLSFSLIAHWSDSKASVISTASFLSSKPVRKMFVFFHFFMDGKAYHKHKSHTDALITTLLAIYWPLAVFRNVLIHFFC